jgi:hypothetical protein
MEEHVYHQKLRNQELEASYFINCPCCKKRLALDVFKDKLFAIHITEVKESKPATQIPTPAQIEAAYPPSHPFDPTTTKPLPSMSHQWGSWGGSFLNIDRTAQNLEQLKKRVEELETKLTNRLDERIEAGQLQAAKLGAITRLLYPIVETNFLTLPDCVNERLEAVGLIIELIGPAATVQKINQIADDVNERQTFPRSKK